VTLPRSTTPHERRQFLIAPFKPPPTTKERAPQIAFYLPLCSARVSDTYPRSIFLIVGLQLLFFHASRTSRSHLELKSNATARKPGSVHQFFERRQVDAIFEGMATPPARFTRGSGMTPNAPNLTGGKKPKRFRVRDDQRHSPCLRLCSHFRFAQRRERSTTSCSRKGEGDAFTAT
jgi:hypothetical protein